jgi:hypothetical protein
VPGGRMLTERGKQWAARDQERAARRHANGLDQSGTPAH